MSYFKTEGSSGKVRFTPTKPEKYLGDATNIVIRSSWEARVFKFCDDNPHVIKWCSEEIAIPYMKPLENGGMRPAQYFPDLYIEYENKHGELIREVFEVKPEKFTKKSRARKAETKLFENYQYIVNMSKFAAAEAWCKARGMKFTILSEKSIFRK